MISRIVTFGLSGTRAFRVTVETDITRGIPYYDIVGLGSEAVRESRKRIRAAIINQRYDFPSGHVTQNLAPADVRKVGSSFDLPLALGILCAGEERRRGDEGGYGRESEYYELRRLAGVPETPEEINGDEAFLNGDDAGGTLGTGRNTGPGEARHSPGGEGNAGTVGVVGELSLDGTVRPVKGVLPAAVCCREEGIGRIIIPFENYEEASLCPEIEIWPVKTLREAADAYACDPERFSEYSGKAREAAHALLTFERNIALRKNDQADTAGCEMPASGENGKPDCGNGKESCDSEAKSGNQTGLAEGTGAEDYCDLADVYGQHGAKRALEIAAAGKHNLLMVGSPGCGKSMLAVCLKGILPDMTFEEFFETSQIYSSCGMERELGGIERRPFRAVHRGITRTALIGGGKPLEIGEVSLAHNGVLFLDELSEMPRGIVESLRQPLEEKKVFVNNCGIKEMLPANFLFVGAANPCPCGNYYEKSGKCTCSYAAVTGYASRISGAILDRMDIRVNMRSVDAERIGNRDSEPSAAVKKRVEAARQIQRERYRNRPFSANGDIDNISYVKECELSPSIRKLLSGAVENFGLSVRAYEKIVKVARTIADLDGREMISEDDVLESLQYRGCERSGGGAAA